MGYKEDFIELMLEAEALTFGSFITKSGRQTPYFINTGKFRIGSHIARLGSYYAAAIRELYGTFDFLYGPAYKGIPLVTAAASSLYTQYGIDLPYCFNRKEAKDHGEGGIFVGFQPKRGMRAAIVEDVVTAGTAFRESYNLLSEIGVEITSLFVSVDRMERGTGIKSALDELSENYGVTVRPIITVRELMEYLKGRETSDKLLIDDGIYGKMEAYLSTYGAVKQAP